MVLDQLSNELRAIQAASNVNEPTESPPELEFSNLDKVIGEMHGYIKEFRDEFVGEKPIQEKAMQSIVKTNQFYDQYRDLDSGYEKWRHAVDQFRDVVKNEQTENVKRVNAKLVEASD